MNKNSNLTLAKRNKNDEFYTQYKSIEQEIEVYYEYNNNVFKDKTILLPCNDDENSYFTLYFLNNFYRFGIKELVCVSYARGNIQEKHNFLPPISEYESNSTQFDPTKSEKNGRVLRLHKHDIIDNTIPVTLDHMSWEYLEGDGDFRSEEVCKLRDSANIVITNPPFSLFRDFVDWLFERNKKFAIIGNINSIACKNVFSLIKTNKMWLGGRRNGIYETFNEKQERIEKSISAIWYTNLHNHKKNEKLVLSPQKLVLKYCKGSHFEKYDNYDAINVDKVKWIPSDYDGVMGVPLSFLNKYNPDQFEIVALGKENSVDFSCNKKMEILDKHGNSTGKFTKNAKGTLYKIYNPNIDQKPPAYKNVITGELYSSIYARILIRHKRT